MRKHIFIVLQAGLMLLLNCQQSTTPEAPQKTLADYDTQYRVLVKDYPSLFTLNTDGTNRMDILDYEGAHLQEATVNSELSKIAFAATFDETYHDIYIMNMDGSDLRKLSNHPSDQGNLSPRFLPDEQALIYHANSALRRVNYDGSGNEQITPDSIWVSGQSSSTANGKIIFTSNMISNDSLFAALAIMNTDGSDLRYYTDGEYFYNPAISPDGKKVCYVDSRDVYVMNLDGTGKVNLTNDSSRNLFPGWTPGGDQISFISNRDGNFRIYLVDLNGGNLRKIPTISEKKAFLFTCSPDLTRISYAAFIESPNYRNGIFIVDIESGERMWFTSGIENPVWLNPVQ